MLSGLAHICYDFGVVWDVVVYPFRSIEGQSNATVRDVHALTVIHFHESSLIVLAGMNQVVTIELGVIVTAES